MLICRLNSYLILVAHLVSANDDFPALLKSCGFFGACYDFVPLFPLPERRS
jgi:hypothetical protein